MPSAPGSPVWLRREESVQRGLLHPLQPLPAAVICCNLPSGPADEWKTSATLEPLPTPAYRAWQRRSRHGAAMLGPGAGEGWGLWVERLGCGAVKYVNGLEVGQQQDGREGGPKHKADKRRDTLILTLLTHT